MRCMLANRARIIVFMPSTCAYVLTDADNVMTLYSQAHSEAGITH